MNESELSFFTMRYYFSACGSRADSSWVPGFGGCRFFGLCAEGFCGYPRNSQRHHLGSMDSDWFGDLPGFDGGTRGVWCLLLHQDLSDRCEYLKKRKL